MGLRLVLIDEHQALREGLELLLAGWGLEVVGSVGDRSRGARTVRREEPDVVLMADKLGPASGVELTAELVAERRDRAVILFGESADPATVRAGLDAGARGYLLRSASSSQLVRAVEVVGAGRVYLDPDVRDTLRSVKAAPSRRELSAREREILGLLADGHTGEEVAVRLVLSTETVKTHVRNALVKLGARNRTHGVAMAVRDGLLDPRG